MNAIFYFVTILLITQLFVSNSLSVYGQAPSDTDALILMVNIERIQAQLWLTEQSLNNGNPEMAFAHAFIPHTTTFPALKEPAGSDCRRTICQSARITAYRSSSKNKNRRIL